MKNNLINRFNPTMLNLAVSVCFMLISLGAAATTIEVDVDRNPVEVNESFAINFTANEAVDGQPDFRPIEKDFKIISRNQSSSIQIINGRMSRQTKWSLYVMPKRAGKLWIPSVAFGDDKSPRFQMTVNSAKAQSEDKSSGILFLESEVDQKTVYVQAQIVYTVRIYQAVNLLNASLSEVSLSDTDAIIEKVGEDQTYNKRIDGRRFKVFEKRYIIFPQKSGRLTINPAELEAQYVDNRQALRTKLLQSDPINITVKPKPLVQTVQNNAWLPAKQIQIKEEWPQEPPVFKVGEPVTRTITMVANGLSSAQLPEINMGEVKDMKQYLDQPLKEDKKQSDGVVGMRQEKIALIPTKTGHYVIPGIEIPWWNTDKDRLEYLRLPRREITVTAGAQTAQADPGSIVMPESTVESNSVENKETQSTTPDLPVNNEVEQQSASVSGFWMWVSLIALCGWIITALAWWLTRKPSTPQVRGNLKALPSIKMDERHFAKALATACEQHNAQEAKNALINWGKCMWPNQSPSSLNELSRITGGPLGAQLLMLNTHLYSNKNSQWDSTNLLQAFSRFEKQPDQTQDTDSELLPLYKTTV
ncbi:BatD family protein [Kaarinaea lacus]